MLIHDPTDGKIGCTWNRDSTTVISEDTVDSAAFVRFEIPDVRQWSIGFVYHDPAGVGGTDTVTIISRGGSDDAFARHWVRRNGNLVEDPAFEPIVLSEFRLGMNDLAFRTSSTGSFLRLNDVTVIEVPASRLSRLNGFSELCVGFHKGEVESYSIRYWDLRTRFVREGESGSITQQYDNVGGKFCTRGASDVGHIASDATDSWILFDFIEPNTDQWSIGIVHNESMTFIARDYDYFYSVKHVRYNDSHFEAIRSESISSSLFRQHSGRQHRLEFETAEFGILIFLNGEKVFELPSSQLTRRSGDIQLCANINSDESEPYTIRFSDLWAWAE